MLKNVRLIDDRKKILKTKLFAKSNKKYNFILWLLT